MIKYPFILHPQAHEEYVNTFEWYELQRKDLGISFMNTVELKLNQISEHPLFYKKIKGNFRSAKIKNFLILLL